MKWNYEPRRLDELLQLLFDEVLTDEGARELNAVLQDSSDAREHYRKSVRLHTALIRYPRPGVVVEMREKPKPQRLLWLFPAAAAVALGMFAFQKSRGPVARLAGSTAAVWTGDPADKDDLSGKSFSLADGFVEISYRSGVSVILEGPCQFKVTSEASMDVAHGRATVKVPHHIDGFHLDTPAGRITDLGTEFGVAVGSGTEGPVVLTEVFDGEIEIPAEKTPKKRMQSGDSLAIVNEGGGTRLVSMLGDYRVDLGDSARRLPSPSVRADSAGNLALGKPVTSTTHYSKSHGSVFPAASLTDGRLNDTGTPGDWSFWLAANGDSGEFTIDLLESFDIGRIDFQNTRNRTHGDRGLQEFRVLVSEDNLTFIEVLHTKLSQIVSLPQPGVDFPFESFHFDAVKARYVRVIGLSHYRSKSRPLDDPNEGGGLNEIRIFAP